MNDTRLPPELERLEAELAGRPAAKPPDGLRRRVLAGVRVELRRDARQGRWVFAGKVAAAVLLSVNLSISATSAGDGPLPPRGRRGSAGATAEQVRGLLPELSEAEALACATALQAGAKLIPRPMPPAATIAPSRMRGLSRAVSEGE